MGINFALDLCAKYQEYYKVGIIKLRLNRDTSLLNLNRMCPDLNKELIPKERVNKICREVNYQYRRRQLTPMTTLLHMLGAALSREKSFQSAWHNSGQTGGSDILCKG